MDRPAKRPEPADENLGGGAGYCDDVVAAAAAAAD